MQLDKKSNNEASIDEVFLNKIRDAITENLENSDFGPNELAREVGMSRSQIHRRLNTLTGKSTTHYIRSLRLAKAKDLLAKNVGNVSEIATRTGFNSVSYFSMTFTEEFGYPPSGVRKVNAGQESNIQSQEVDTPSIKEDAIPEIEISTSKRKKQRILKIGAPILIVLIVTSIYLYQHFNSRLGLSKTIAILPFKGELREGNPEDFARMVRNSIQKNLESIRDLDLIISSDNMESYRNGDKTIPEIASELNVSYLLKGSFYRNDQNTRIEVQLLDSHSKIIWSNNYEKSEADLFWIGSTISEEVAGEMSLKISSAELNIINGIPTQSIEAYKYYALGRKYGEQFLYRHQKTDFDISLDYYNKALNLDSNFCWAVWGIGNLLKNSYAFNFLSAPERFDTARYYFKKAIELDPNEPATYESLGDMYYERAYRSKIQSDKDSQFNIEDDINFRKARAYYETMQKVAPGYSPFNGKMGILLIIADKYDSALLYLRKGVRNSPGNPWRYLYLASCYYEVNKLQKAELILKRALEIKPEFLQAMISFVNLYLKKGDLENYLVYMKKLYQGNPMDPQYLYHLTKACRFNNKLDSVEMYAKTGLERFEKMDSVKALDILPFNMEYAVALWHQGNKKEAQRYFDKQIEISHRKNEIDVLAKIFSFYNEKDSAFFYLKKRMEKSDFYYFRLIDPLYDNIRNDPGVQKLVNQEKALEKEFQRSVDRIEAASELPDSSF